ncbi:hypothetical protein V8G54_001640 [Vigna mungo]|uniref:Uncharacterized protein n=1 Tax=Vigna mungo TaxID=3915 RepID=A0AAQ3P6P0_VIGMU
MASLVMLNRSKNLTGQSSISLTHFSFWCCPSACWVNGNLKRSSMHLYNSERPDRPQQIFSTFGVEDDDASNDLSLLSSSSLLAVLGCDLVGKLMDLTPYLLLECFGENVAILALFILKGA